LKSKHSKQEATMSDMHRKVAVVSCRDLFMHRALAALTLCVLFPAVASSAQGQQSSTTKPSSQSDPKRTQLEHVVYVEGLSRTKPGANGTLTFDKSLMLFSAGQSALNISLDSIIAFSISRDNVALISGTKGKLAGMAPYGVGQVISAIRPSVDTLTLLYRDSWEGVHGCIFILPKGTGDNVVSALAESKLPPSNYPKSGEFGLAVRALHVAPNSGDTIARSKPFVEVDLITETIDGVPSAFPIAEYEELVSQLTESGLFTEVWRQGDTRRAADAFVLHVEIYELTKGSARARALVPFTGATVIKTKVTLSDPSGRLVFQQDLEGSKRLQGESLDATASLAKRIRKELERSVELKSSR
jgi:hypothetical protein